MRCFCEKINAFLIFNPVSYVGGCCIAIFTYILYVLECHYNERWMRGELRQ